MRGSGLGKGTDIVVDMMGSAAAEDGCCCLESNRRQCSSTETTFGGQKGSLRCSRVLSFLSLLVSSINCSGEHIIRMTLETTLWWGLEYLKGLADFEWGFSLL